MMPSTEPKTTAETVNSGKFGLVRDVGPETRRGTITGLAGGKLSRRSGRRHSTGFLHREDRYAFLIWARRLARSQRTSIMRRPPSTS